MIESLSEFLIESMQWKLGETELKQFSAEQMNELVHLAPHIVAPVFSEISVGVDPATNILEGRAWIHDNVKAFVNQRPNISHFDGVLVSLVLDAVAVASWSARFAARYGEVMRVLSVGGMEFWRREACFFGGNVLYRAPRLIVVQDLRVDWRYHPDESARDEFPWDGAYQLRMVGTTPDHPKQKEWTLYARTGTYRSVRTT